MVLLKTTFKVTLFCYSLTFDSYVLNFTDANIRTLNVLFCNNFYLLETQILKCIRKFEH